MPTTVTPEASSVTFTYLGQQRTVALVVRDQTGAVISGPAITWTSDDPAVVEVSAGVATAVAGGSTTLRASAGTASTSVSASVSQVVADISLSDTAWSFSSFGDTLRLEATVEDSSRARIPTHSPEWTSLDTMVVTVSGEGLVTARGNGSTAVTAAAGGVLRSARVTVDQRATAFVLPADSVRFTSLGDTATVEPMVLDGQGNPIDAAELTWSSQDESVVTVSASGRLMAAGNGSTAVTVTAGLIVTQVEVEVAQSASTLELEPDSIVLADPGDQAMAVAMARDAGGSAIAGAPLAWQSRDAGIADVAVDGTITAFATGSTFVVVTHEALTDSVAVSVEPELTLVALGETTPEAVVDTEVSLAARVETVLGGAYSGAQVAWSVDAGSGSIISSGESESDATGHVSAVWRLGSVSGTQRAHASLESRGNTVVVTFTATAQAGPAATASLSADTLLLSARGETAFLAPAYFDAFGNVTSGSGVSWVSRDPAVVTAATDGLVTGGANEGTTWIVAFLSGSPVDSIEATLEMRGAITVTFDDGWRSVYENAWPVLQTMDIPANVAVYTEAVGFPAYMTEAHLNELHDAGWAMVAHTVTHDSLPNLSAGELDFELRAGQEWLVTRGYRGSNVFVAPYHEFEDREKTAAAIYYTAARGYSANTISPDSIVSWMPDRPFDLTGFEGDDLPYTTTMGRDRLRTLLQRTLDEGAFIDLFFHQIPAANAADFQALMDVVDEFRERVLTYDQLYPVFARGVF
ncbi:MAG: polysaccharide deacetylase family protein [Gemmatimonadetes bacterium]|nr:polysaccharide deacetylase family protein [Gemmatimonadota bacterium]